MKRQSDWGAGLKIRNSQVQVPFMPTAKVILSSFRSKSRLLLYFAKCPFSRLLGFFKISCICFISPEKSMRGVVKQYIFTCMSNSFNYLSIVKKYIFYYDCKILARSLVNFYCQ